MKTRLFKNMLFFFLIICKRSWKMTSRVSKHGTKRTNRESAMASRRYFLICPYQSINSEGQI